MTIRDRVDELIGRHGSLRAVARVLKMDLARWVNRHHAKNRMPFDEYNGSIKSADAERYDEQQGLFV